MGSCVKRLMVEKYTEGKDSWYSVLGNLNTIDACGCNLQEVLEEIKEQMETQK